MCNLSILFTDLHGERGTIRRDLTIEYEGRWGEAVENAVEQTVKEYLDDRADELPISLENEPDIDPHEVYQELIVRLPELAPVVAIELSETDSKNGED